MNLRRQAQIGAGFDNGYERVFEEEFGAKRQPGVNCVVTNNCTFAGASGERSTYNSKVYAFGSVTPNKKLRVFFIARTLQDSFDFDFGAGQRYPRVSPSALSAARAVQTGLCSVASPPAVCNAPLDPGPGTVFSMNTNLNFQPTAPLNFNLDFTKQRLRRNDTGLLAFDENIVTFKTTYQFTRFIFVRGRIDFDSLQSNAKGQFLFGWIPNPGTAFYVGYNVGGYELGLQPDEGAASAEKADGAVAYWGVAEAEAAFRRLLSLGAAERTGVQEVGEGIRVATVFDPFGNIFGIIENPHFKL